MNIKPWIWKSVIAGFCGTIAHWLVVYFKIRTGLLPSFQPYQRFQIELSYWIGDKVPAFVPWALSFVNGTTILGFLYGRFNRLIPGQNGAIKGLTFGLIGWVIVGFIFFPLLGLGPFAIRVGLGMGPALFSLFMVLTYSVVLGVVYAALNLQDG